MKQGLIMQFIKKQIESITQEINKSDDLQRSMLLMVVNQALMWALDNEVVENPIQYIDQVIKSYEK